MNKTNGLSKTKQVRGTFLLLLTAFIWGCAFVAQSVGMDYVGAITYNCVRSYISVIALLAAIPICDRFGISTKPATKEQFRDNIVCGICYGCALFGATTFQQLGIMYDTPAGKAGFITALYIVLVPVIGFFLRQKTSPLVWVSVVIATVGMYLLCIDGSFSLDTGDVYVIMSAVCFAVHILIVANFTADTDGLRVSCVQFLTCAIISTPVMFIFESPSVSGIVSCSSLLLYSGVLSGAAGYTLQIIAQKDVEPTIASLVLSLESVFAVLAGWVILGEGLNTRELIGCVLMFAAILLAQLPPKDEAKSRE